MILDASRTVREFATEIPGAPRTFEKFGIDYCCGGAKSLYDACAHAHVSLDEVLRALEHGGGTENESGTLPDFTATSLRDVIEHIIARHHSYVKQEIPRIHQLLQKVVAVHGQSHPELERVRQTFEAISGELISHMMKEEQILFPYIAAFEVAVASGKPVPRAPFGTVSNPIQMMELEHASAGEGFQEIDNLTGGYNPPSEACFSYRTLYAALKEFEADLHQHVHLENNILFPRAIELEQQPVRTH